MRRLAPQWSDNDRCFGPFIYAKAEGKHSYRPWAIELSSGDDEYPANTLRFSGLSRTLIIVMPNIIRPWKEKFGKLGEHYHVHRREFGFSLSRSGSIGEPWALRLKYGAQTHSSLTEMDWYWCLPWTNWRHVRHSLYDLNGDLFLTVPEKGRWTDHLALIESCPKLKFEFVDFDGESLTAVTRIEEHEWRFGRGWFAWLSWFRKPKIQRSLDIEFSGETGKEKGSWKGGTIGHSIGMLPGELHESAFRRYCANHGMTLTRAN